MSVSKGELTGAEIDRKWPHQIALPAEIVRQRFAKIEAAKVSLGMMVSGTATIASPTPSSHLI